MARLFGPNRGNAKQRSSFGSKLSRSREYSAQVAQTPTIFFLDLVLGVRYHPRPTIKRSACMSCGRGTSSGARSRLFDRIKAQRRSSSLHSPRPPLRHGEHRPPDPTRLSLTSAEVNEPFTTP